MTSCEPRSDRNGKAEPAPPETLTDEMAMPFTRIEALADAYRSWELAIEELHKRKIAELLADHVCLGSGGFDGKA